MAENALAKNRRRDNVILAYGLGIVATGILLAVVAANWGAKYKLAGIEIVIVAPVAMTMYLTGLGFAISSMRSDGKRRLNSFVAMLLNWLPLTWMTVSIVEHGTKIASYVTIATAITGVMVLVWIHRRG